jgi:hypothetical protein
MTASNLLGVEGRLSAVIDLGCSAICDLGARPGLGALEGAHHTRRRPERKRRRERGGGTQIRLAAHRAARHRGDHRRLITIGRIDSYRCALGRIGCGNVRPRGPLTTSGRQAGMRGQIRPLLVDHGAFMEQSSRNRQQTGGRRKRRNHAETVAVDCDQLPEGGADGVQEVGSATALYVSTPPRPQGPPTKEAR